MCRFLIQPRKSPDSLLILLFSPSSTDAFTFTFNLLLLSSVQLCVTLMRGDAGVTAWTRMQPNALPISTPSFTPLLLLSEVVLDLTLLYHKTLYDTDLSINLHNIDLHNILLLRFR